MMGMNWDRFSWNRKSETDSLTEWSKTVNVNFVAHNDNELSVMEIAA